MLRSYDLALSGYSPSPFPIVATKLLGLRHKWVIKEVLTWDFEGRFYETKFHAGTDLRDADSILEYDFMQIKRLVAVFGLRLVNIDTNVQVEIRHHGTDCLIDGMVYLASLLADRPNIEARLKALADFVVDVAIGIDAIVVSLVDEDNPSIIRCTVPLKEPLLFSVFKETEFPLLTENAGRRQEMGVVWIQAAEAFVNGVATDDERKRDIVARLADGLNAFTARRG